MREVFDFEYAEIARIVEKTEANCRQLFARAKQHLGAPQARFEAPAGQAQRLVERFTTLWADGGGKTPGAALKPVRGADAVARFVLGVMRKFAPRESMARPPHRGLDGAGNPD